MLWVDKYRPSQFDDFIVNKDKAESLRKLSAKGPLGGLCFACCEPSSKHLAPATVLKLQPCANFRRFSPHPILWAAWSW